MTLRPRHLFPTRRARPAVLDRRSHAPRAEHVSTPRRRRVHVIVQAHRAPSSRVRVRVRVRRRRRLRRRRRPSHRRRPRRRPRARARAPHLARVRRSRPRRLSRDDDVQRRASPLRLRRLDEHHVVVLLLALARRARAPRRRRRASRASSVVVRAFRRARGRGRREIDEHRRDVRARPFERDIAARGSRPNARAARARRRVFARRDARGVATDVARGRGVARRARATRRRDDDASR